MSPSPARIAIVGARRVRQGLGPFVARFLTGRGAEVCAYLGTSPASVAAAGDDLARIAGVTAARGYTELDALLAGESLDALVVLSPTETHGADLDAALEAWAGRVVDEYRSVLVFSELLHLLGQIEAPFSNLAAVQRLLGDELRHTRLCADVVRELDVAQRVHIDLTELALPPADDPAVVRAYTIVVRELAVAEQESVRALRAFRDACDEPVLRSVFAILLQDEVRHAALGRHLEQSLRGGFGLDELATELAPRLDEDRASLRTIYRASAVGGPGRRLGACLELADWLAAGVEDGVEDEPA